MQGPLTSELVEHEPYRVGVTVEKEDLDDDQVGGYLRKKFQVVRMELTKTYPENAAQPFGARLTGEQRRPGRDRYLADAIATAEAIAANAPLSVKQAKKSIHYGLQMDLLTGYRFEIEAYNRLVDTEDRHEGVRAFNEKRKPVFQGR